MQPRPGRKSVLDMETVQRLVAPMTLMHDGFAHKCLHDNVKAVERMLRVILDREDLSVREMSAQKWLPGLAYHGVRFDVFARDGEGRAYNIEIQAGGSLAELAPRSRLSSAWLDRRLLPRGEPYAHLAESYVIFILDRDLLGHGQPLYKIDRYFPVDGVYHPFGDGAHIIFVNATIQDDTPLGLLMRDLNCPDPARMHYEELAAAVAFYKCTKEGAQEMRDAFAEYLEDYAKAAVQEARQEIREEGRAEGRAEGREENKRATALSMLAEGFAHELTARLCSLPLAEVQALAAQRTK